MAFAGSMRYSQATHGLAVVGGYCGHDLVRRIVAAGQPGAGGRCTAGHHGGEKKFGDCTASAPSPRLSKTPPMPLAFSDRRRVDWCGVIARDHHSR